MKIYLPILMFAFLVACNPKTAEDNKEIPTTEKNVILLTNDQETLAKIQTGQLVKREFSTILTCVGNIEPTPAGHAQLTAPLGGFVRKINHYIGEKVKKGDALVILENPDFISLQEDFVVAANELEFLQNEFKRKQALYEEKAVSEKEFLRAKSDFMAMKARHESLKSKILMIGLDPDKIGDHFTSQVILRSPLDGYISKINGNIGKFFEPQSIIIEIVNPNNLHLHLKVFEKDISKILTGQLVRFSTLSEPEKKYTAKIFSRGHSINKEDLSVTIHASIDNKDENLIPGLFVNAEISVKSTYQYAIPKEGLYHGDETNYIFVVTENGYKKIAVETGVENDNFVSILEPEENILNSKIVINGAYFLNAAIEGSEEE